MMHSHIENKPIQKWPEIGYIIEIRQGCVFHKSASVVKNIKKGGIGVLSIIIMIVHSCDTIGQY